MLKKQILTLCALFTLVLACSKKDNPGTPANATVKAIQDYLSQTDSLQAFGASFQLVTFADADVSGGLTVFAPINSAVTSYDRQCTV